MTPSNGAIQSIVAILNSEGNNVTAEQVTRLLKGATPTSGYLLVDWENRETSIYGSIAELETILGEHYIRGDMSDGIYLNDDDIEVYPLSGPAMRSPRVTAKISLDFSNSWD